MSARKHFYPWADLLPKKVSINLATFFGLGNLIAPGTWGAAMGLLIYIFTFKYIPIVPYAILAILLVYISAGICDSAERHLGMRDPGKIILDEIIVMPICYFPILGSYISYVGLLIGFALFRFFDIKKPFLINKAQNFEGGLGVVADDVAAAIATCICLNLIGLLWTGIYM